jgi:hypothetical protein
VGVRLVEDAAQCRESSRVVTPVDLAQVQRRAQRILDVAQLTVGQVDRTACVDDQQFDAANAALREHVAGRWGEARDLAALALVLVDELAVSRALIDDLEARLAKVASA